MSGEGRDGVTEVSNQSSEAPYGASLSDRPRRRSRRKMLVLGILILLLLALMYAAWYYLNYRKLPIPRLGTTSEEEVVPPEYLFSIAGPQGEDALTRPIGVAVSQDGRVFATDTKAGRVRVYDTEGNYQYSFGDVQDGDKVSLDKPAHIAIHGDELYASDRRLRAVYVFDLDGTFKRVIRPEGEDGEVWSPLGMDFDAEGNLYVTDVGDTEKHRVLVFAPDGSEIRRFGKTGQAETMSQLPGQFYFPNGVVMAEDGRLYIGDSDNRRVQVFGGDGTFSEFIRTAGIPRGLVIDSEQRLYVVDALGHMVDIYTLDGEKITSFGGPGTGPGQFRYANDIALDANERIYITDRDNHQVQVWQWPAPVVVTPTVPDDPWEWALCLSPLLLIPPLLLLARRRRFAVTPDFVGELALLERVPEMDRRRFKWVTPEYLWPRFEGRVEAGIDLGSLVHEQPHSESDVHDLMKSLGVAREDAILLVVAKRARALCTEDAALATMAYSLGIEVFDARHFLERFEKKDASPKTPDAAA